MFALAVEWVTGSGAAPSQGAALVRSWWEQQPGDEPPDDWGESEQAQAALDQVKAAFGAPSGVVRPQPGGLAAVASPREQPPPSGGDDTPPP